jgi:hypothetical protein
LLAMSHNKSSRIAVGNRSYERVAIVEQAMNLYGTAVSRTLVVQTATPLPTSLVGGRRSLAKFTEFRLEEVRDIVRDHDIGWNQYQRDKCREQNSEA